MLADKHRQTDGQTRSSQYFDAQQGRSNKHDVRIGKNAEFVKYELQKSHTIPDWRDPTVLVSFAN